MAWSKGVGVIEAGEAQVTICMKKVATNTEVVAFTDDDKIGELTDISGFGAQRETKEINGYHYDSKVKKLGSSTPNDLSLTENLTTAELAKVRAHYNDKDLVAIGVFDSAGNLMYGCTGGISQWGETVPNGDVCTLTYNVAIEVDSVAHTKA